MRNSTWPRETTLPSLKVTPSRYPATCGRNSTRSIASTCAGYVCVMATVFTTGVATVAGAAFSAAASCAFTLSGEHALNDSAAMISKATTPSVLISTSS